MKTGFVVAFMDWIWKTVSCSRQANFVPLKAFTDSQYFFQSLVVIEKPNWRPEPP